MTDPAIVLLDEHIVVVDKPAGMPSVPARTPLDPPSVVERLAAGIGAVEAVHRLDRDTSGLLVLARTPHARAALGRAFEQRHVQKTYLAVVAGGLPADAGTIHLPLAADPNEPPRQRVDPILGRRAESRWRRLAEAADDGRRLTLVALEPITGRSHQLRAHLAWLGAPIAGDPLYGAGGPTGLALHATRLSFPHPADGRPIDVHAPPPAGRPWSLFSVALLAQASRDVGMSADSPTRDQ
jgi:tRNA pseudouridine32 synthase/23S rRNA pseudouridine746 synthase